MRLPVNATSPSRRYSCRPSVSFQAMTQSACLTTVVLMRRLEACVASEVLCCINRLFEPVPIARDTYELSYLPHDRRRTHAGRALQPCGRVIGRAHVSTPLTFLYL